jgi:hypothetical protein
VTIGESEAISNGNNRFCITPKKSGQDTLKLYIKSKLILKALYQTDLLPNPIVRVGHNRDTLMTVNRILLQPFLNVIFPGTNYKGNFFIRRFSIEAYRNSGDITGTKNIINNKFTAELITLVRGLERGDKLHIFNIVGGGPGSRLVTFPSFTVLIQ